jgi:hypothetical protein
VKVTRAVGDSGQFGRYCLLNKFSQPQYDEYVSEYASLNTIRRLTDAIDFYKG